MIISATDMMTTTAQRILVWAASAAARWAGRRAFPGAFGCASRPASSLPSANCEDGGGGGGGGGVGGAGCKGRGWVRAQHLAQQQRKTSSPPQLCRSMVLPHDTSALLALPQTQSPSPSTLAGGGLFLFLFDACHTQQCKPRNRDRTSLLTTSERSGGLVVGRAGWVVVGKAGGGGGGSGWPVPLGSRRIEAGSRDRHPLPAWYFYL